MSPTTQWTEWAPIVISAIAVLVATVFGMSNRSTAKKALSLAQQAEARRSPQLDLYVNDSAVWRSADNGAREYGVHLMVVNPTDRASAIVMAELHVLYSVEEHLSTVKIPAADSSQRDDVDAIELPRRLDANGAASGWLLFHVSEDLVRSSDVQRYDVVVRDVHDTIASVQVAVFREVT